MQQWVEMRTPWTNQRCKMPWILMQSSIRWRFSSIIYFIISVFNNGKLSVQKLYERNSYPNNRRRWLWLYRGRQITLYILFRMIQKSITEIASTPDLHNAYDVSGLEFMTNDANGRFPLFPRNSDVHRKLRMLSVTSRIKRINSKVTWNRCLTNVALHSTIQRPVTLIVYDTNNFLLSSSGFFLRVTYKGDNRRWNEEGAAKY